MTFDVKYSSQASKFLKKSDTALAKRIIEKISTLMENPIIHDSKRIQIRIYLELELENIEYYMKLITKTIYWVL